VPELEPFRGFRPQMRILIVTPHYWPEAFRITDIAEELVRRGHRVEVLTNLPNYPAGRFFEGYGLRGPYRQEHAGAMIHRVLVVPRGRGGAVRLALNYVSFAIAACLRSLPLFRQSWDVVFVFGTSPVTALLPAALLRAARGVPVVVWVQDLWPESIAAVGFARIPGLYRVAGAISGWLYRHCDRVLGTSRAFQPRLAERGVPGERFDYLPQWAESVFDQPVSGDVALPVSWPKGFVVLFAGNLGRAQGLGTILDAAERLRSEPELRWAFLGDGSLRPWLEQEIVRRGLADRMVVLGRRPVSEMPAFYATADAMIVSLQADEAMALTVPAKLQSCLAAGRPVVGSIDGEAARIIEESGAGWAAAAGDAAGLAAVVRRMMALPAGERAAMGQSGREFARRHFDRSRCLDQLEATLSETAGASLNQAC
jgi:colanic acid biosynthesis glycosyl transferase WcaI